MKMIHNPHCVALGDVSEEVLIKNAAERLEIDRPEMDHRVRALSNASATRRQRTVRRFSCSNDVSYA